MVKIAGNQFIVTGGASGLGRATTDLIVARGGKVVIMDFNEDNGVAAAKAYGGKAVFHLTDVTDAKQVQAGIELGESTWPDCPLRGVVNCAGTGMPKKVLSRKLKVHDMGTFEMVVKINLHGTFNVLRLAAQHMAKRPADENNERGVIINTASVAAFEGQIGQAAYSASKAAVVGMTLPIARELASNGIRINTIAPGLFLTPMLMGLPEKARKSLGAQVPFPPRLGQPSEYASLVCEMMTNGYFNGTVVRLDGSIRMAAM